jgi:hypothetical protein
MSPMTALCRRLAPQFGGYSVSGGAWPAAREAAATIARVHQRATVRICT